MKKKKAIKSKIKKVATKKNAEKAIKKTGNFLSDNQKAIFYIGVFGILGYAGYKVYKGISNVATGVTDIVTAPPTDFIDAPVIPNSQNVTISEARATLLSKTLLEAFNHTVWGFGDTDEEKIEIVFEELKTGDDYKVLFNDFGRRPWVTNGSPEWWLDKQLFSENKDLNHWLKEELSSIYDKELYQKVKSRVESAGMIF